MLKVHYCTDGARSWNQVGANLMLLSELGELKMGLMRQLNKLNGLLTRSKTFCQRG